MGDGPDWRQLDRAKLQAARAEERRKLIEEWAVWLDESAAQTLTFITDDSPPAVAIVIIDVCASLGRKAAELRARLSTPEPELPPAPEPTADPDALATRESKA